MSDLLTVINEFAADDVRGLAETVLLNRAEMLLEARSRLDGEIARTLQAVDVREVTVNECGRQTKSWLIEEQHRSPGHAGQRRWVARRLRGHPDLADALASGDINHDHVHVILGCLTTDLGVGIYDKNVGQMGHPEGSGAGILFEVDETVAVRILETEHRRLSRKVQDRVIWQRRTNRAELLVGRVGTVRP
jgi:hypothetical protein